MKIKQLRESYLNYKLLVTKPGTVSHDNSISHYLEWFDNIKHKKMTKELLNDFVMHLKKNTAVSNVTINKCIRMMKAIYKYADISCDALISYKYLKETKKRYEMFTSEEQKRILQYVNTLSGSENSNKYKIMIYTLWDTSIRQNELIHLEVKDIMLEEQYIYLKETKSNEERIVFFSDKLKALLTEYIKTTNFTTKYLFYNDLQNRLFRRLDFKYFYQRLRKQTNVSKAHSHMFRHTWATNMLDLDVPLEVVQKQLGHANISTTMIYVHQSISRQQKFLLGINREI